MRKLSRKHPVHLPPCEPFNAPIIVFVTVCTKNRKPVLVNADAHALLRAAWVAADSWLVGRYVIMPDHIHLFCAPAELNHMTLTKWIAFWKSHVSRHRRSRDQLPLWQSDFWDRHL